MGNETILQSDFASVVEQFRQRLRVAVVLDIRCRYEFANKLRAFSGGLKAPVGRRPLAVVARHLDMDESAVRRMAVIAATISPDELEWLLSLPVQIGWHVTWSHLEALATVRQGSCRASHEFWA